MWINTAHFVDLYYELLPAIRIIAVDLSVAMCRLSVSKFANDVRAQVRVYNHIYSWHYN